MPAVGDLKSKNTRLLHALTSWLINMHEDHVIISSQNGVELLVANRRQLGHVPSLTMVHRHMNHPQCALRGVMGKEGMKKHKKKAREEMRLQTIWSCISL